MSLMQGNKIIAGSPSVKMQEQIATNASNIAELYEHDTTLPMTAVSAGSTEEEINNFYDNYSADMADCTEYKALVNHGMIHSILGGGAYLLEGVKKTVGYEWQTVTSYLLGNTTTRKFTRSRANSAWSPWKAVDIGNVLTASKNVYVDATNGNDTTGDGTQAKPWKTIQKAVDECPSVCTSTGSYVISVADGTYSENINIMSKSKITINFSDNLDGVVLNGYIRAYYTHNLWFNKNIKLNGLMFFSNNTNVMFGTGTFNVTHNGNLSNSTINASTGSSIIFSSSTFNISGSPSAGVTSAINSHVTFNNGSITNIDSSCTNGLSAWGGDIRLYNSSVVTNNASTAKYLENLGGKITFGNGGWQLIGSVTGANSVAIDSNLYTEFEVIQTCAGGSIIHHFSSGFAGNIYDGYYKNSGVNAEASIAVNNTSVQNSLLIMNGTDRLSETTMTVKGRRA